MSTFSERFPYLPAWMLFRPVRSAHHYKSLKIIFTKSCKEIRTTFKWSTDCHLAPAVFKQEDNTGLLSHAPCTCMYHICVCHRFIYGLCLFNVYEVCEKRLFLWQMQKCVDMGFAHLYLCKQTRKQVTITKLQNNKTARTKHRTPRTHRQ